MSIKLKRFIAAILCLLMIAGISLTGTSCANSKNQGSQNTDSTANQNAGTTAETEQQTTADPGYLYGGQKLDFKGETFTILYPNWDLYPDYYFAEQETGDAVNDALYKRMADTDEFFNIDIKTRELASINDVATEMKKEVMSGTNSFDIALTHCVSGLDTIVTGNLAYNWNNMPNVDFSKKYWNQSMNEYLNINGYMPFVANDFVIPSPCFITFSKDLLKQYGLEDPYQLVKSGKWTWDKLSEMAKQVSKDVDGDGKYTENDLYGFVGELDWQFVNAMYSCNQYIMTKDADGHYVFDVNTSKTQDIVNKLYDLLYVGNQTFTYVYDAKNQGKPYIPFDSGRALFYMSVPSDVKALRATDFDFGILPYPKLDENQANYISLNWAGTICAPLNISNPEKVGAVVDYLGAESYSTVWPAYFDVLLNGKLIRDDDSKDMLDIIYNNSIYDFGLNFSNFNDLLYIVPKLLQSKSTDVTSFYEKRAAMLQKNYDKIYDAFIANSQAG
ncbi:MAG: hypothetical protein FWD71_00965 [Oscillospiraceae bacterium]|nr:hypothetical protein [Oscillospiraceae bacterium]